MDSRIEIFKYIPEIGIRKVDWTEPQSLTGLNLKVVDSDTYVELGR
jgi:hypothetical protein